MSQLAVRVLSAAVAASVLFSTFFWGGVDGLYALTGVVVALSAFEFANFLIPKKSSRRGSTALFVLTVTGIYISSYFSANYILPAFWFSSLILVMFWLFQIRQESERKRLFRAQCFTILGLFYVGILSALTAQLLRLPNGPGWLITLLSIVFFGDSGAYFAGRFLGNRLLFPLVSPKKTWEGAIGGALSSAFFGGLFGHLFIPGVNLKLLVPIAIFCGAIGQVGDLFESLVKRVAGVKDSGSIMPGHGGMLDRIDGVLFAAPAFYYLVLLLLAPQ